MKKLCSVFLVLSLIGCSTSLKSWIPGSHDQYDQSFAHRRSPIENPSIASGLLAPKMHNPYSGMHNLHPGISTQRNHSSNLKGYTQQHMHGMPMHHTENMKRQKYNHMTNQHHPSTHQGQVNIARSYHDAYNNQTDIEYNRYNTPRSQHIIKHQQAKSDQQFTHPSIKEYGKIASSQTHNFLTRKRPQYNENMKDYLVADSKDFFGNDNDDFGILASLGHELENFKVASHNSIQNHKYGTINEKNISVTSYQQQDDNYTMGYYIAQSSNEASISQNDNIKKLLAESQDISPELKNVPEIPQKLHQHMQKKSNINMLSDNKSSKPVNLLVSHQ